MSPAASGPVIEVVEVSKAFGSVKALDHVSLELHSGEVVALVGDNGAGKSTLINLLCGILEPDEGRIVVRGEEVHLRSPADAAASGIATVHQKLALVDTLDIGRNIYLGRTPTKFGFLIDHRRMYTQARGALAMLRSEVGSVRTIVGDLSGGQRQAVAIARALAYDANVFLMDEPTAALGVAQTAVVNEIVLDLKAHAKAVVVITHNMLHAFEIADRILVLRLGRLVAALDRAATTMDEVIGLITGSIGGVGRVTSQMEGAGDPVDPPTNDYGARQA
jgi:ABC-type sugar transport system ATPase subunit